MAEYPATFVDDSGETRLSGTIILPDDLVATTLNGVVVDDTPPSAGDVLTADSDVAASWQAP